MNEILMHYSELITDPAHTLVEFTFVLVDYIIIQGVVRRWSARRDRAHGHYQPKRAKTD